MYPEIISRSDDSIVFKVEKYSDITSSLLEKINNEHKKEWMVFRAKSTTYNDIDSLKKLPTDKYFSQIGFCSNGINIDFPDSEKKSFTEVSLGREELLKLILETYKNCFENEWSDYLGHGLNDMTITVLKEFLNIEKTLVLKNNITNKYAGILMTFPSDSCLSESLEQIGWVWIDSTLEKDERVVIKNQLFSWLQEKNYKYLQAGVHLLNNRSQKFFVNMGFEPKCVHISLK